MPVRAKFYLEEIVADQLAEVAGASLAMVQGILRHLTKPGECSGPGKVELTDCALRLERAINPDKLKFDDPQRIAIMPRNWPTAVWSDLRDIRHHFDNVIGVCDWKDLCDGPNPLRRWEPIPLNGFVCWPQCEVDNADLQKIESAANRLKAAIEATPQRDSTAVGNLSNELKPSHSADFTFVNWFGSEYRFTPGQQAEAIKHLWGEFEKGGLGLAERTIGELIGSNSDDYRLTHTFRSKSKANGSKQSAITPHPAWGTMIQKAGPGIYRLAKSESRQSRQNPA
jgi:hypothetical protein